MNQNGRTCEELIFWGFHRCPLSNLIKANDGKVASQPIKPSNSQLDQSKPLIFCKSFFQLTTTFTNQLGTWWLKMVLGASFNQSDTFCKSFTFLRFCLLVCLQFKYYQGVPRKGTVLSSMSKEMFAIFNSGFLLVLVGRGRCLPCRDLTRGRLAAFK